MSDKRPKTQAISLLEGILEETQTEAAAERLRMEAELRRKDDVEKAAREQAERQRRAEGERRLAEEDERRRQAAERRAAEVERLRIEELKAKGLWKEPEPAPVVAPTASPASTRPQMSTQEAMAVAAQANRKSTLVPLLIAAIVLLGLAGAGGGYWWSENRVFVDATTVYAKADPQTSALQNAVATIGFEALPPPVILPAPEIATPAATAGPRRTGPARSTASPAETGPVRLQLGGNVRGGR